MRDGLLVGPDSPDRAEPPHKAAASLDASLQSDRFTEICVGHF